MDWSNSKWATGFVALKGRGSLRQFHASNKGAADVYLMFFDSDAPQRTGAIPLRVWSFPGTVTAGLLFTLDHEVPEGGRDVEQGICIAVSSTADFFTGVTAEDFLFDVGYDVKSPLSK